MIPAQAVEAAARAYYEASAGKEWSVRDGYHKDVDRSWMEVALEAAAPHMLAAAWKEGEAAGQDNAYAYQIGHAVKSNPYRSAL